MRKKFSVPAIIIGSGVTGLGITRALGTMGIPVINISYGKEDIGKFSRYSEKNYKSPFPGDYKPFKKFLEGISPETGEAVIFPSDDSSLNFIHSNKHFLTSYFRITSQCSEIKDIDLLSQAENYGLLAPRIFSPVNFDQASWFANETGYPVLMSAADGSSMKDVFHKEKILVENIQHLKNLFTIASKFEKTIILTEYIPGNYSASYSSFSIKGTPYLEFTSEQVRSNKNVSGPRIIVSKYIPEIFELSRKILGLLKYDGYSTILFKKDFRNSIFKLQTIVHRFDAPAVLAFKCGINFAYHSYINAAKSIVPEECSIFRENVYWIDAGKDLEALWNFRKENIKLKNYFSPYVHRKVFAVPVIRDPLPFFRSLLNFFKEKIHNIITLIGIKSAQQGSEI